jgi:hypothetical protein
MFPVTNFVIYVYAKVKNNVLVEYRSNERWKAIIVYDGKPYIRISIAYRKH